MNLNLTHLQGLSIRATDGIIGDVKDVFFDDDDWAVRYLVVDTGNWLSGRTVLISPHAIGAPDWLNRQLAVSLTMEKIRQSPDVDTHRPVSRQYEEDYSTYYGYPYYWGGAGVWGLGAYPGSLTAEGRFEDRLRQGAAAVRRTSADSHLRSAASVMGHHLHATDGDIGHVVDILVDDRSWSVRRLVVEAGHWWSGHRVLIAPGSIADIDWPEAKVTVNLTRQAIQDAPEYLETSPLNNNASLVTK